MCKHFLRGTCRYGDSCRGSHVTDNDNAVGESWVDDSEVHDSTNFDSWDVPQGTDGWPVTPPPRSKAFSKSSQGSKSTVCKFFAQGECRRGDLCFFRHVNAPFPTDTPSTASRTFSGVGGETNWSEVETGTVTSKNNVSSEPCQFYNSGKCPRGTTCPFLHNSEEVGPTKNGSLLQSCQFYIEGRCVRGNACPFPHHTEEPANLVNVTHDLCELNKAGKCTRGAACPFLHASDETNSPLSGCGELAEPCQFFGKGMCARGNQCPFRHVIVETLAPTNSSDSCPFHSQGRCAAGSTCGFAHSSPDTDTLVADGSSHGITLHAHHENVSAREPCTFYEQGRCHKGIFCPFQHVSSNGAVEPRSEHGHTPFRSLMACKFFSAGDCRNGDACTYSHASTDGPDNQQQRVGTLDGQRTSSFKPSTPCRYYQRGNCNQGDACRFTHIVTNDRPNEPSASYNNQEVSSYPTIVVMTRI